MPVSCLSLSFLSGRIVGVDSLIVFQGLEDHPAGYVLTVLEPVSAYGVQFILSEIVGAFLIVLLREGAVGLCPILGRL